MYNNDWVYAVAHQQTRQRVRKLGPHNHPYENQTCVSVQDVTKAPELQTRRPHFRFSRRIHLGFTISKNLSLDSEISRRIGKATGTMSNLTKKARDNKYLTWNTKMHNYHACVLSIARLDKKNLYRKRPEDSSDYFLMSIFMVKVEERMKVEYLCLWYDCFVQ